MARWLGAAALLSLGCRPPTAPRLHFSNGTGATSDWAVLPAVDGCDDFRERDLHIDPSRPLHVLVHGCHASSSQLRTLATVFRAQGKQALCFNYDDRDSLEDSADRLAETLAALRERVPGQRIAVVAHSQGGLVARRALIGGRDARVPEAPLELITISSPFAGIEASRTCGAIALHVISLGITAAVCHGIAGDKWTEISPNSDFVRRPGTLDRRVGRHLKIVTDERGICRRRDAAGRCVEDDFVFSLEEQAHPRVDADRRTQTILIREGHARVIGGRDAPPLELIDVLERHGVLDSTSTRERRVLVDRGATETYWPTTSVGMQSSSAPSR